VANENGKTADQWSDDIHEALEGLRVSTAEEASNRDQQVVLGELRSLLLRWGHRAMQPGASLETSNATRACISDLKEALKVLYPKAGLRL